MKKNKKTAHEMYDKHDKFMLQRLKKDPKLAVEVLKAAFEECEEEGGDYAFHKILRMVAKAQGLSKVAKKAGIPPESLSRALSPRGNPRLSTLLPVIRAMGLQLTLR